MSSNTQNFDSRQSNQDPHQYSPQILFELFRKSAEDAEKRAKDFEKEMRERDKKREEEKAEAKKRAEEFEKEMKERAEEFEREMKERLGSTQFDVAERNMKRRTPEGESIEIDFFMENGNAVGIVEIKHKVQRKHIDQLDKIIAKFKKIYPFYKDYKIVGAIAGKIITQEIKNLALKKGYFVLKQQGDHIETIPPQSLEI